MTFYEEDEPAEDIWRAYALGQPGSDDDRFVTTSTNETIFCPPLWVKGNTS